MIKTDHIRNLLLYAQRALLGEVSPNLRVVSLDLSLDGRDLKARFEYDYGCSKDDLECASCVMTCILADYSENHRTYVEEFLINEYPSRINPLRLVAY